MATVTGTLHDFGMGPLAAFSPKITFRPSGPGVTGAKLLATKPITVVPDESGYFTVELEPTDAIHPDRWYTIAIEWLDASIEYIGKDILVDWKLRVPQAGGPIGQLVEAPSNPAQVWTGLTPPMLPTRGTWWLVVDPDNLFADPLPPLKRGQLYEWS
jgi:hypothetical protein